jgi:hydroxymethylbilane synthase
MRKFIIGSRGSDLALWQAHHIQDLLQDLGCETEIKIITTKGDRIQDLSFDKIEGKGFFTKEIEDALLNRDIDIAVHSHKDLETAQPTGLKIASIPGREDSRDSLLIREDLASANDVFQLSHGAVVGTSSIRRKTQLLHHAPHLNVIDLRGNVPTRIQKLREKKYDAIVLAAAGLARLKVDLTGLRVIQLDPALFVPAPAQGALGIQIREVDEELATILAKTNDKEAQRNVEVERTLLNKLQGGCHLPFGAHCTGQLGDLSLHLAYARTPEEVMNYTHFAAESPEILLSKGMDWLNKINHG